MTLSVLTLALGIAVDTRWLWLTALIAAGFLARVLTGPTLSPLGQLATRVVAPRLGREKLVPGPPKRFAQAIGATLTVAATVLLALGHHGSTIVLLADLLVAASLESPSPVSASAAGSSRCSCAPGSSRTRPAPRAPTSASA